MYARLQIFMQLSPTLTKLCHIKRNYLVPQLSHLAAVKHPMSHGWPGTGIGGNWYGNVDNEFSRYYCCFIEWTVWTINFVSLVCR